MLLTASAARWLFFFVLFLFLSEKKGKMTKSLGAIWGPTNKMCVN